MRRDIGWRSAWILLAIASLSSSGDILGQCEDERIEPRGAVIEGKTLGQWTAVLWQWLAAMPADEQHPFLELDGANCAREQDEAVFFLPGSLFTLVFNGEPFPRDQCVVPCKKPILLGLTWALMWAPGDCDPGSMQDCVELARNALSDIAILEVTLDGTPLPCPGDRREASPVFEFLLPPPPAANLFDLGEPLQRKAVSDGYWYLLKPLQPGKHTIFINTLYAGEPVPVLYELTVAPCDAASFRRGDADGNQAVNLTDAVYTLSHLFQGGDALSCDDAADANDSGQIDLSDAIHMLNHLFRGGAAPPAPGPDECGTDPTEGDGVGCGKGC